MIGRKRAIAAPRMEIRRTTPVSRVSPSLYSHVNVLAALATIVIMDPLKAVETDMFNACSCFNVVRLERCPWPKPPTSTRGCTCGGAEIRESSWREGPYFFFCKTRQGAYFNSKYMASLVWLGLAARLQHLQLTRWRSTWCDRVSAR